MIFTLKKIIISWVNYRTLHVKQADVAKQNFLSSLGRHVNAASLKSLEIQA